MWQLKREQVVPVKSAAIFWQEKHFKPAGSAVRPRIAPHFCTPKQEALRSAQDKGGLLTADECAWVALVSITDHIFLVSVVLAAEFPFQTGGDSTYKCNFG